MKGKIVIIAENDSLHYVLRTVFNQHYEVSAATNVVGGLIQLKRGADIIILDLDPHIEECVDFIHHVANSLIFRTPILALSSHLSAHELIGDMDFVTLFKKPFNPVQLLRTTDQLLQPAEN